LAEHSPKVVPFEGLGDHRPTTVMSPPPWLPPLALAWTSEYRPRPPNAVLVEHIRLGLGVLSYLYAYPSRSSVVELPLRCDTKWHPLLPLARVRSMSRYFPFVSEFTAASSGLVELLVKPSTGLPVPKNL